MRADPTQNSRQAVAPYPPRYRWLKRCLLASTLVIVALAAARWWWGYKSRQVLDAEIAAFHARGEPILPEDFDSGPVPDAENAAFYLKQAAAPINQNPPVPAASNFTFPSYFPYPKRWMPMAEKAVGANRKSFELVNEARRHKQIDWGVRFVSPTISIQLAHLNAQRSLANLLADTATYEHLSHNDAAALDRIEDLLFQARTIDHDPILVTHLVSIGIEALATHRVQLIAPGLTVSDGKTATQPGAYPATREQVKRVIAQLLDEEFFRDSIARCLQGEQVLMVDTLRWVGARSVLRPMFELDAVRLARRIHNDIVAATQPNWPAASTRFAAAPANRADFAGVSQIYSKLLAPSVNRAALTHFRVTAERRFAAVSLAVRLYVIDHDGKYPPALDALVPEYLSQVPPDPYAADGHALHYLLAENGKRPIVYSIDENGTDDTDAKTVFPQVPMNGWQMSGPDQWRDLSRFAAPPSTQPASTNESDSSETEHH